MRQCRLDDRKRAEEIGLHLGAKFCLGRLLDGPDDAEPNIVNDDVDASKAADRRGNRLLCLAGCGHVKLVHQDPVGRARGEPPELINRACGRDHVVPPTERKSRESDTKSGGGALDEPGGGGHAPPFGDICAVRQMESIGEVSYYAIQCDHSISGSQTISTASGSIPTIAIRKPKPPVACT